MLLFVLPCRNGRTMPVRRFTVWAGTRWTEILPLLWSRLRALTETIIRLFNQRSYCVPLLIIRCGHYSDSVLTPLPVVGEQIQAWICQNVINFIGFWKFEGHYDVSFSGHEKHEIPGCPINFNANIVLVVSKWRPRLNFLYKNQQSISCQQRTFCTSTYFPERPVSCTPSVPMEQI